MTAIEVLNYLQQEIHTTVVATTDKEGLPVTCAIDMMDADEKGLYFLTAKGKSFYNRVYGADRHERRRYYVLRGGIDARKGEGAWRRSAAPSL